MMHITTDLDSAIVTIGYIGRVADLEKQDNGMKQMSSCTP